MQNTVLAKPQFNQSWILIFGASFALLAVALGAFAAHGLKSILTEYSISIFKTAVDYQMHHALALLLVGILSACNFSSIWCHRAAIAFITGIMIFSGSLYTLALTDIKWLGAITPIGGVAFLVGWIFVLIAVLKGQSITQAQVPDQHEK